MKQGWTVMITLWDNTFLGAHYHEAELRDSVTDMLKQLPPGITYQHIYIKKHKTRLKK
jgi:hypothetical protein